MPWSSGVEGAAASHGADQYLPPLVEMSRRIFPSARCLKVQMEDDPVIEDDCCLVFVIEAPLSVSEAVAAIGRWYRGLFECCPPAQAQLFCLRFRVAQ
jgi:hypothetical protein